MPKGREQENIGEVTGPPYDHPKLQRLYEYWREKMRDGRLPARGDVDPLEIPELLGSVSLIDVVREREKYRYRFRLFGTQLTEKAQRDYTGEWLDEVLAADRIEELFPSFEEMIRTREPIFRRRALSVAGRQHIGYERLDCPLAEDGETVDTFISVWVFDQPRSLTPLPF